MSPFSDRVVPMPELRAARILIVDDQVIIRRQLEIILGKHYLVTAVSSGADALLHCEHESTDLILMDAHMPEMDGLETCLRLKKDSRWKTIPVVFVTARTEPELEIECWNVGANDFISKPVHAQTLLRRVKAQLTLKSQADNLRQLDFLDAGTGVYARRYFDQQLPRYVRHAKRTATPLALLLVRSDYLKAYTYRYGQVAGEKWLHEAARSIKSVLRRPWDFVARYATDKFVCLLPDTNLSGAEKVAANLIQDLQEQTEDVTEESVRGSLSVSVGIVAGPVNAENDADDLLQLAKVQLCKAKRSGRNMYCSASYQADPD